MVSNRLSMFWTPIGDFRTQLGWRLIGFAMCQVTTGDRIWPQLGGALLIVFGPRLITLGTASVSGIALLVSILTFPVSAQVGPAEEFLVFAALPPVAILIALLDRSDPSNGASAQHALLRLSAVLLMFFAGFHKLNGDFFVESVSCATFLSERLDAKWAIPLAALGVLPNPTTIVSMELGASLLLLLAPRAGILMTAAVLIPIALFGPTAFVTTVLALAMAGLGTQDGPVIGAGLRKHWRILALLWLGDCAAVFFLYEGRAPIRVLAFLLVATTLPFLVGLSLANDWRGPSRAPLLSASRSVRWALIGFVACGLLNGFAPYLGLKYKMSTAMFSNLRVDDDRWNHFLVPKKLYLREHDPFIHVERVDFLGESRSRQGRRGSRRDRRELSPALVSPQSLRYRIGVLRSRKENADLTLRYRGEQHHFPHVADNREFFDWLTRLPDEKLFQLILKRSTPQTCVH
jgi:hypothetical protein